MFAFIPERKPSLILIQHLMPFSPFTSEAIVEEGWEGMEGAPILGTFVCSIYNAGRCLWPAPPIFDFYNFVLKMHGKQSPKY